MYMVPQSRLAPAAARMPPKACWACAPPPWMVLKPSMMAAATIARAPRTTLAMLRALAPLSSPNNNQPQKMPTSELVFQSGKAMARPTSRMANTVSVLATAHNMPAMMAVGMRWRLAARSEKTLRVPLTSVGRDQRAVKTPATMHSEIAKGERPVLTSLVGASAAPSHTPAPRPHSTPRPCMDRNCFVAVVAFIFFSGGRGSMQSDKKGEAAGEDGNGEGGGEGGGNGGGVFCFWVV